MLYTVPWFPELSVYRTPEMPGTIVHALFEVAAQARSVARTVPTTEQWIGVLTVLSGTDEERVRKALWLADRLGLFDASAVKLN